MRERERTSGPARGVAGRGRAMGLLLALSAAGCGGEAAREEQAREERAAIAEAETTATRVAALPATGKWSAEQVLERLVRAGVAPRPLPEAGAGPEWMGVRPVAFAAGGGEVWAWVYADSTARRAVTDGLDPATGTPAGKVQPWPSPMVFVVQNNLSAVITGGSETNQERIALALQAGVPAAPR